MKANTKNKKNSVAKKLVPAAGMLALSASMLATSTYAWFTMSREVEVTNIQMTASVPADLQISLGRLSTEAGSGDGLVNGKGILVPGISANGTADNGGVAEPGDTAEYWSNIADVSAYYSLGKIMPASSTDGTAIYFTPDSSGVGKTLKSDARYYTAVTNAGVINKDSNGNSRMTTLHAYSAKDGATISDTWASSGYVKSTDWDATNDDGYFVDIPVWIRSSSTDGDINLSVDAYVTTKSKKDDDDLYLAARAVILGTEKTSGTGLIEVKKDAYSGEESIVDFMSTTNSTGAAVASIASEGGAATYGLETYYDGTTDGSRIVVPASTVEGKYGTPVKVWIRVWLEGEDSNCWNENAGQDFNISLKFSRDNAVLPTTTHHYSQSGTADSTADSLVAGTTTIVRYTTSDPATYYKFTYDGANWQLTAISTNAGSTYTNTGTFLAAPTGAHYVIGGAEKSGYQAIVDYIKANITTKELADGGITMTSVTDESVLPTQLTCNVDADGNIDYNTTTPSIDTIDSVYINGVNYGANFPGSIAGWIDGAQTLTVDIVYNENAPHYTVTYHNVDVTGDQAGTLKIMKVKTVSGGTTTYAYYVAADNTFKLNVGTKIGTYDTLEGYVGSLTGDTAPAGATTVNYNVPSTVTVPVVNDPQGRSIALTKTVSGGTTTWTYTAEAYDRTGATLTFSNGTTTTAFNPGQTISFESATTPTVSYSAYSGT